MQPETRLPGGPMGYGGAALLCIFLGSLFGAVSFATLLIAAAESLPIRLLAGFAWIPGGAVGGFFGTLCAFWLAPSIRKKPTRAMAPRQIWAVTPVVILAALSSLFLGPIGTLRGFLILVGIPVLWFVVYSLWLAHSLDDAYGPGQCQQCGYDLTGNISGTCPECGQEIERP